ncbi:helix-turn-helix domain-containing protein [Halorhabdus rudnickae]|uniref:helix-turn-helix domain-containing protein n=1 Tax=Halorhabdus rudnickae TaxID=1775544 RepID=UPI0010825314|nr:helix-turn-helix domain-containing protein [Halorhabdus rudnickae]
MADTGLADSRLNGTQRDGREPLCLPCGATSVELRPLRLFETEADRDDDGQTTPQHEALRVVYRMGYFDMPRESNLSELADELNTITSALSERLGRGQRQLLERTIAGST